MAGCFDNIQLQRPEWMELGEKRNAVASILSGTMVSRAKLVYYHVYSITESVKLTVTNGYSTML